MKASEFDSMFTVYRRGDGRRMIENHIDQQYRNGLAALAGRIDDSVEDAITEALARGSSPKIETERRFGAGLTKLLLRTTVLVGEIEMFMPGFTRWLDVTEYGNDHMMIDALLKWIETVEKMPGGRLN